jgi:hypothetical protein
MRAIYRKARELQGERGIKAGYLATASRAGTSYSFDLASARPPGPRPVIADALGFHYTTTTRQHPNAGALWSDYADGDHHTQ